MGVIAEYRLHLKFPSGETIPVWLRIHRPERLPTGLWECRTETEGRLRITFTGDGSIPGLTPASTSWQALMFGLRWVYHLIRMEVRGGAALYDESGKYPVHLDELFPFPRDGEASPLG